MILICYDGSADAQSAIDHAARLLPGAPATVLTVWETFVDLMSRSAAGAAWMGAPGDGAEFDRAAREAAEAGAREGAERAGAGGLNATPAIRARSTSIAEAVLAEADEVDADAILLGSRGITGVKSLFLGSVSHAVLQHAGRPVIVVPSPAVATRRMAHRADAAVSSGDPAPDRTSA